MDFHRLMVEHRPKLIGIREGMFGRMFPDLPPLQVAPEADLAIDEAWGNFFRDVFEAYISRSARQMVEHIKALGYRKPDGSEWLRKDFRRIVHNPIYAGFIA